MKTINKSFILLFCLSVSFYNLAQIKIGGNYNVDIYKPYTPEAQSYIKINDKVDSRTINGFINFKVLTREKMTLWVGISYKHINHEVQDKIKRYYYYSYGNGTTVLMPVDKTLDLKSESHSFGLMNEFSYSLASKEKLSHEIGITNEIYLLEFFKSFYYYDNSDEQFNDYRVTLLPMNSKLSSPFFFSSANLAGFYRFTYHPTSLVTTSVKVSFGTNLYSNWDQFQKYAWVGLGLEIGLSENNFKSLINQMFGE